MEIFIVKWCEKNYEAASMFTAVAAGMLPLLICSIAVGACSVAAATFVSLFWPNCCRNYSLVVGLWYRRNRWPFTKSLNRTGSIVVKWIAPLLKTSSISYGPNHLVYSLPIVSLYLESYNSAQSLTLNFFSLIYLSCHFSLWFWINYVCWTTIFLHSSRAFNCWIRSFCASDNVIFNCKVVFRVLCSNSICIIVAFP